MNKDKIQVGTCAVAMALERYEGNDNYKASGVCWPLLSYLGASECTASTITEHQGGFVEKISLIRVFQKLSESRYLKDGQTYSGDLELIDIWSLK